MVSLTLNGPHLTASYLGNGELTHTNYTLQMSCKLQALVLNTSDMLLTSLRLRDIRRIVPGIFIRHQHRYRVHLLQNTFSTT